MGKMQLHFPARFAHASFRENVCIFYSFSREIANSIGIRNMSREEKPENCAVHFPRMYTKTCDKMQGDASRRRCTCSMQIHFLSKTYKNKSAKIMRLNSAPSTILKSPQFSEYSAHFGIIIII